MGCKTKPFKPFSREGEPSEPYGIRPGPGACCPDAHYIDGKCTGCGHEEKG
jgi:hypothetical protein